MSVFLSLQDLFEPAVPLSRPCYSTEWRNVFIYFYSSGLSSVSLCLLLGVFLLPLPPSDLGALGLVGLVRWKRAGLWGMFFSWLLVGGLSCLSKELICCGFNGVWCLWCRDLNGRCSSDWISIFILIVPRWILYSWLLYQLILFSFSFL